MQRVLDLDLDAFVYGREHCRGREDPRLDPEEFPPWEAEKIFAFLSQDCGLTAPRPGAAVEHHADAFYRWRDAIDSGLLIPPFEVVHVDAHSDVGFGDNGYIYLFTDLLTRPQDQRQEPDFGEEALNDSNFLLFALAAGWISKLTYVIGGRYDESSTNSGPWQPGDLLPYIFEDSDLWTRTIRLPTFERKNLMDNLLSMERLRPLALEPPVPFDWTTTSEFYDDGSFDYVSLARSPSYTPAASDVIYDEICERFISEASSDAAG